MLYPGQTTRVDFYTDRITETRTYGADGSGTMHRQAERIAGEGVVQPQQQPANFLQSLYSADDTALELRTDLRKDAPVFMPINTNISEPPVASPPDGAYSVLGMTVNPLPIEDEKPPEEAIGFPWWPMPTSDAEMMAYHSNTRLTTGEMGLLVDPGAHGNLMGSEWAADMRKLVREQGLDCAVSPMNPPLEVQGVGDKAQTCRQATMFPIATVSVQEKDGSGATSLDSYTAPEIPGSAVPALLGLQTLRAHNAVLECGAGILHMCGPGPLRLQLPPGSKSYQLEEAPSGHLILPCSRYLPKKNVSSEQQGLSRVQPPTPSTAFETSAPREPPGGMPGSSSD